MATLTKLLPVEVVYDITADDCFAALKSFPEKVSLELADRILSQFTQNELLTDTGRTRVQELLDKHQKALENETD